MNANPKRIITLIGDSLVGFTNAKADEKYHNFEVKHDERIQAAGGQNQNRYNK